MLTNVPKHGSARRSSNRACLPQLWQIAAFRAAIFLVSVSPNSAASTCSEQHVLNRAAHRYFRFWDHDIEVIGQNGWKGGDP